jgi:hypothetical protein
MRIAIATAAAFEAVVSTIGLLSERLFGYAIYLNPHVGVVVAEQALTGSDRAGWFTLLIGALILAATPIIARNRKVAAAYVVLQSMYAIAVGFIFLVIAAVNMSGSHGPSRSEVVLPAAVLLVSVVVPVALTFRAIMRSSPRG